MKFSDYESSHITPQMTLLKKLNEVLKFLRETNLDNELNDKFVDINETINSGSVISSDLISKLLKANFVKYKGVIFTLSRVNYTDETEPRLYGLRFSCFDFSGDETTFTGSFIYINLDSKTFTFNTDSYHIGE